MKVILLSDIHANWEALSVISEEIYKLHPDFIIHLGDVVGYGAEPEKCCKWVRENCDISIIGNHDAVVVNKMDPAFFSTNARTAIEWTKNQLTGECINFLGKIPYTFSMENILFCHGSPVNPENFDYILDYYSAEDAVDYMKETPYKILFVGHSHKAFILEETDGDFELYNNNVIEDEDFHFKKDRYYIVSLGSVGQPRDGDPRSSFTLLDTDKMKLRMFRYNYDMEKSANKIRESGLPDVLAKRLFIGK